MLSGCRLRERGNGPGLLVVDVGPSWMQPVIFLRDFGDLGAKMITPSLSPLQPVYLIKQLNLFNVNIGDFRVCYYCCILLFKCLGCLSNPLHCTYDGNFG
jgi:hypothetical protein